MPKYEVRLARIRTKYATHVATVEAKDADGAYNEAWKLLDSVNFDEDETSDIEYDIPDEPKLVEEK